MDTMPSGLRTLLAIVLVSATAAGAHAQAERGDCQRDVAEVRANPRNSRAIWAVASCPSSGAAALTSLWAQPGVPGGAARPSLVDASGALRDARLFTAVTGVATDGVRPTADRLAALQVLMRYYDSRYEPTIEDLTGPRSGASVARRTGGPAVVNGTSPLPGTVRQQIAQVTARLAASENDGTVREAAHRLRQRLASDDPANTPLPPGSISLIAGCGRGVTLRSTADVEVVVRLAVLGAGFERNYGVGVGSMGKPRNLLLVLPAGTVVGSYGGREVARLSERTAPCAPGAVRW